MSNKNLEKKNRYAKVLLMIVGIVFIIHTIYESIWLYNCEYCSAPWHVAVVVNLYVYTLPLIALTGLKIYFYIKLKRRNVDGSIS